MMLVVRIAVTHSLAKKLKEEEENQKAARRIGSIIYTLSIHRYNGPG